MRGEFSTLRTELCKLLVVPSLAPHPVQPNGESTGHGYLGDLPSSSHCQVEKLVAPFLVAAHRDLRGFHQQETQQTVPLFRDVAQPATFPAGIFLRHQPEVTRNLLAAVKP